MGGVSETVDVRKENRKEEDAWAGKKAELTARTVWCHEMLLSILMP
jgi:hypothetical protein